MDTTTTTPKRTLGDLTIAELLESLRGEIAGLEDLARRIRSGEDTGYLDALNGRRIDMVSAYAGSIGARVEVALMKVREDAATAPVDPATLALDLTPRPAR